MPIIHHLPTAVGIAIGHAHLLSPVAAATPQYWLTDTEVTGEMLRFKRALQRSKRQLTAIRDRLCRFQGRDQIQILDSHLLLIQDELLVSRTIQQIANQKINAEWALEKALEQIRLAFCDTRETYLLERRNDIDYVGQRLMKNLMGSAEPDVRQLPYREAILVAHDLSPAEVAALPRDRVKGFVTAVGGNTSHTAIIARSLEIPCMVGVERVMRAVREGDLVILDGVEGALLVRPNDKEIAAYRAKQHLQERERRELIKEGHLPAVTRDGYHLHLAANIELLEEIPSALEHGAEAIGMYRTEYLYLNRSDLPTEEEHYRNYRRVVEQMAPRPVTIRTLDIGGDKLFAHADYQEHANPALGLRAIRFCLQERQMFRVQVRAIYRASVHGPVRMLFPLLSTMDEVRQLLGFLAETQEELRRQRIPFDPKIPLGAMIEVPSAVILADHFARVFQFFSIGTNDLTQYGLAVDRTNEHVSYLFQSLNPAVLRMIHQTVAAARRRNIPVTLCGEMAANPVALLPLLGLELGTLSMNAISIPRVKQLIRRASLHEAKLLAGEALAAETQADVERLCRHAIEKLQGTDNAPQTHP